MAVVSRTAIDRELTKQLKAGNRLNAITRDQKTQYLAAWERKQRFEKLYSDGIAENLDAEELLPYTEAIAREQAIMVKLLAAMGVTPRNHQREELSDEIYKQLDAKGLHGPVFDDLADRYLKLWDAFQDANQSLVERGRSYLAISSTGKQYEKDNSASKDIVSLERAMREVLGSMDITVEGYAGQDDDEL